MDAESVRQATSLLQKQLLWSVCADSSRIEKIILLQPIFHRFSAVNMKFFRKGIKHKPANRYESSQKRSAPEIPHTANVETQVILSHRL